VVAARGDDTNSPFLRLGLHPRLVLALTMPARPFKLDLAVTLQAAQVAPLGCSGAGGWVVFIIIILVVIVYIVYVVYTVVVVAVVDCVGLGPSLHRLRGCRMRCQSGGGGCNPAAAAAITAALRLAAARATAELMVYTALLLSPPVLAQDAIAVGAKGSSNKGDSTGKGHSKNESRCGRVFIDNVDARAMSNWLQKIIKLQQQKAM
jgi:hypothetical protein